ncbi:S-layer homology domain-containing protein [Paenibacillus lutimineralis]|uniref:SLH domain-containing protein n=1 Tax=Paenibacillus lutimineralis TaxID=2707005 RepID=A0A3Q9I7G8_9BACL|nr:S-layer homology domain-containing protein [Paenibacillus lutimineralis]AZS14322.1 hypothetical protein EI981_07525 [Paenibacillus lutimineralis]
MRLKNTLSFILCFVLIFSGMTLSVSADEAITAKAANGNTISITAVNRAIGASDEMILFTRENSSKLTDSNPYAAAAVVDYHEGTYSVTDVTYREGAVQIPTNGFVLFGHGSSEQWIKDNMSPGYPVEIVGYTLPDPIVGGPQLITEQGIIPIDVVDQDQPTNTIAVYTRHFGKMTRPFSEDTVQYIITNDVVVVKSTYDNHGQSGTYIPANGYVISASGNAASSLNLVVGQSVQAINVDIPILPSKYLKVNGIAVGIDKINGPRGTGEVVLYQPTYGATTNQNAWGMELTVVGNKVTNIVAIANDPNTGGYLDNNSSIPADGYVLSIQASSPYYDQLAGKVSIGTEVELVTDSLIYQAARTSFDAFNPKVKEDNPGGWDNVGNVPYPGFRGSDQLIVYDRNYGEETGTNPWGNEVIVNADGYVTNNGGNNSKIPEGGYVLSGHGVKNTWLKNNALVGAKLSLDFAKKEVLVIFTPESYLDKASISIDSAEKALQSSKNQFMDVPYADIEQKIVEAKAVYELAKQRLNESGTNGLMDLLNDLDQKVTEASYMNFESPKVQTRGLWMRPKEKNLEQVRDHVKKIKETGINAIYLETWWNGYTTWPTSLPDTELNPLYEGFDVLGAFIEEGKKQGIEIHAWVENFFVGGPVVVNHPDWRLISRQGIDYEVGINNAKWYWLNPALPQARDFVASVYNELITKYDIASLHLDYARYPDSKDYTNDFGYDTYTRNLFSEKYGVDPLDLHPGDRYWDEWLQFRADIINTWVVRVVDEAHQIKPKLQITTAVWPNYEEAPKSHAQEAKYWLDHNLIDHLYHMSYAPGSELTVADLRNSMALAGDNAFVSSGLDTFQGNPTSAVVDQITEATKNDGAGAALFEFEGLFNYKYDKVLKIGVYRNEAILPQYDTTKPLATVMEEMIRKINEIYVPFQGMSRQEGDTLIRKIQPAVQALNTNADMRADTATFAKQQIEALRSELDANSSINPEVKNRMTLDLDYGLKMVNIYFSKAASKAQLSTLTVSKGKLTPSFNPSIYTYQVDVDNAVTALDITASTSNKTAKIFVDGKSYANDSAIPVQLKVGLNSVILQVMSEDGLTINYNLSIYRASKEDPGSSSGNGGSGSNITTPPQDTSTNVKPDSSMLSLKSEKKSNGQTMLTAKVSADELNKAFQRLKGSKESPGSVTIELMGEDDIQQVGIPAQSLIDALAIAPNATIVIQGNHAVFEVPVSLPNLSTYIKELGADAKDTVVYVTIEQVKGKDLEQIRSQAKRENATLIDDRVIDFSVRVEANGKTKTFSNLGNKYMKRSIVLDQSIPSDTATAIYIDPNRGRFSFVPSIFTTQGGQTVVMIKQNGTGQYAAIQSFRTFKDLKNHWAKSDIELLASKRVIEGMSTDQFAPDQKVTRAEFVSLLVRSLDLNSDTSLTKFHDVSTSDWFAGAVGAAANAGIAKGNEDGSFRPNDSITREQMAVMISRALSFVGKSVQAPTPLDMTVYHDEGSISAWAQAAVAETRDAGILKGVTSTTFEPDIHTTRAQAAVAVKRMLQYLGFINS